MKLYDIQERLDTVFKKMGAIKTYVADFREIENSQTFILVQIISDGFRNIRTVNRVKMVDEFLLRKDPKLYGSGTFAYDCFTMAEYELAFKKKNIHI